MNELQAAFAASFLPLVQKIRFVQLAYGGKNGHGRERAVAEYPDFTPSRTSYSHGAGISRSAIWARAVVTDHCPSARVHLAPALLAGLL
jgi:hypothetical protein